ncbi:MAG: hypothetical protein M1526_05160 [Candidatus Thermoplasmatota archaeon]|jgi:hypothetical protein|nr:hypothetical protein [Candidatus Thermoplasmatota archaeon]MCL5681310.1 hypothetical protein [Candidatus Thermoplasmatota archaeon]
MWLGLFIIFVNATFVTFLAIVLIFYREYYQPTIRKSSSIGDLYKFLRSEKINLLFFSIMVTTTVLLYMVPSP